MASAQLLPPRLTAKKSDVFLSLLARLSVTRSASDRRGHPFARLIGIALVASASNRLRSDCQLVATLEHPPLEDVAAGFGAHSGSETMHSGTAPVARLVGSFWHVLATLSYLNYSNWQNLVSISGG